MTLQCVSSKFLISNWCSITKMPINVVYCEIHCFFKNFESWKNTIITGFAMFLILLKLRLRTVSFMNYVKTNNKFWAKTTVCAYFYNKSPKRNLDSQIAKNLDSPHVLSLFSLLCPTVYHYSLLANYSEIVTVCLSVGKTLKHLVLQLSKGHRSDNLKKL